MKRDAWIIVMALSVVLIFGIGMLAIKTGKQSPAQTATVKTKPKQNIFPTEEQINQRFKEFREADAEIGKRIKELKEADIRISKEMSQLKEDAVKLEADDAAGKTSPSVLLERLKELKERSAKLDEKNNRQVEDVERLKADLELIRKMIPEEKK